MPVHLSIREWFWNINERDIMAKKMNSLLATTAVFLGALGAANITHAQSSITLYGRIAGGLGYLNKIASPAGTHSDMRSYAGGNWGTSWWGIKAAEDLGGGLSTVVHLESAFSTDDGQTGGGQFNRNAYVGLASKSHGSVWLGRAMGLPDSEIPTLDPLGYQTTSLGTLHRGRIWGSRANAITYSSPSWNGLSLRAQLGLNSTAGSFRSGRQIAGSVSYHKGPLAIKALYEEIRDGNGSLSSLYAASRLYVAGASYQLGNMKIHGGYSLMRSNSDTVPTDDNPFSASRQQLAWLGVNYQAMPNLALLGGTYRAHRNKDAGGATLFAIGANYHISNRTMLYTTIGSILNGSNAAYSVEAGSNRPLAGQSQQGVYTGMVHWF